jgi:LEA14-like dessication related protein
MSRSAAALLGAAVACTGFLCPSIRKPEVTFTGLSVRQVEPERGDFVLILRVRNSNAFPLELRRLTYDLSADEQRFGGGALDTLVVLRARESTTVRLPVEVSWVQLGATAGEFLDDGTKAYRVRGRITIAAPQGTFTRSYDERLIELVEGAL